MTVVTLPLELGANTVSLSRGAVVLGIGPQIQGVGNVDLHFLADPTGAEGYETRNFFAVCDGYRVDEKAGLTYLGSCVSMPVEAPPGTWQAPPAVWHLFELTNHVDRQATRAEAANDLVRIAHHLRKDLHG